MELTIAGSIAGTAEIVQPRQHRQQAVKVFETAQIPLGEIGLRGCHRSPPANMTVLSCCRKQRANTVPNMGGDIHIFGTDLEPLTYSPLTTPSAPYTPTPPPTIAPALPPDVSHPDAAPGPAIVPVPSP